VCKAPPMTSENGKNASGLEAFGSKAKETPVGEPSVVSTADVMSTAAGTGATVAFAAENAGTSTASATKGEEDDLCMADLRPTPDPQAAEAGVPAWRMTSIGAYTSQPYGRRRSSPTAATSMNLGRRRARSGMSCR
jgi:hypothetical protein